MKVKELIRELKKFPNDYKVALESYEAEGDGFKIHNVISVGEDDDAENMLIIR